MSRIRIDIQKDGKRGKATKSAIVAAVKKCQEYPNYELKCSPALAITSLMQELKIQAPREEGAQWYLKFRNGIKAASYNQLTSEEDIKNLLIRMLSLAGLVVEKEDESFI